MPKQRKDEFVCPECKAKGVKKGKHDIGVIFFCYHEYLRIKSSQASCSKSKASGSTSVQNVKPI